MSVRNPTQQVRQWSKVHRPVCACEPCKRKDENAHAARERILSAQEHVFDDPGRAAPVILAVAA